MELEDGTRLRGRAEGRARAEGGTRRSGRAEGHRCLTAGGDRWRVFWRSLFPVYAQGHSTFSKLLQVTGGSW